MNADQTSDELMLFLQEEWVTSRTVIRCTCYKRNDGEFVRHGDYKYLTKSGRIIEKGEVQHGRRTGVWQTFHENGWLESSTEYRQAETHGFCQEWYETGVLRFEGMNENNVAHGIQRTYHPNGILKESATYDADFKSGPCQVYDERGALLADGVYEWDRPVNGTFLIEENIEPGPPHMTFGEYIDAFLNRRFAVVEFRNGEPVTGRRLPARP